MIALPFCAASIALAASFASARGTQSITSPVAGLWMENTFPVVASALCPFNIIFIIHVAFGERGQPRDCLAECQDVLAILQHFESSITGPKERLPVPLGVAQNLIAALTCNVRPSEALLTVPKAAEVSAVFGFPQRWKLKGFTASTLSSAFRRSLIGNWRPMVRASCLFQNPRTQLRLGARLPKLNPVLVVNAAVDLPE